MLTWHIDRLFRSGPLAALITFLIPMAMAILVSSQSDEENVLGILLVSAGVMFIGSLAGSTLTSGLGVVLFSLGTVVGETPVAITALAGIGLYVTLIIHDLSGSFHRAPRITSGVWRTAAITTLAVVVLSSVAFSAAYAVARLATWRSIVVPFGVAAIGFAAKLAADSHQANARQLTAKRQPESR